MKTKKIIFTLCILSALFSFSQTYISSKEAFAIQASQNNLNLDELLIKYMKSEHKNEYYEYINQNEFKYNKLKNISMSELQNLIGNVNYDKVYMTEIFANVSEYDFNKKGFLTYFMDRSRNCIDCNGTFKGIHSDYENKVVENMSALTPSFLFLNTNELNRFYNFPENVAEKSLELRNINEKDKRGKFDVKVYFKFVNPNIKSIYSLPKRTDVIKCYITKIIIYDKYTKYSQIQENFLNPYENKDIKEVVSKDFKVQNNSNINSSLENIEKEYSDQFINYLKLDDVSKRIEKLEDFNGKYSSTNCEKGYFEFLNYNYEKSTLKTSRRNCINILGNENYEYKLYKNYLIYYIDLGKFKNDQSKFTLNILYIDNSNQLVVKEFRSNDKGSADYNDYIYKK